MDKFSSYTLKQELDWLHDVFKAEKDGKGQFWTIERKIVFFTGYIQACQMPARQWTEQDDDKLMKMGGKYLISCEIMKEGGAI